jgi:hypothetical protein
MKPIWPVAAGTAVAAALLIKWLTRPKVMIFDRVRRTDMSRKKLTESSFAYLNRSAQRGSAESRALVEAWLSRIPASEHGDLCARFRSGQESDFTSALQEITLHELLRRQRCKIDFHPNMSGATKQPDFKVREPQGPEFILEARTSAEIESGPNGGTRANRIREFLRSLDLRGYLIGIDELVEGSSDLSQETLRRHIDAGIKAAAAGYAKESISIPPLDTPDGWRITLTAFAALKYGPPPTTVMQEARGHTWTGPSWPLRDALRRKASRYGQLAMPYVIAVNSSDAMVTDRDFEDTLFGSPSEFAASGSPRDVGFWGTAASPKHTRVSAVLFTKNLCLPTLLMGQVYACLYLNPWPAHPYDGVLAKLPTFRFENGEVRELSGAPLHKLLKLRLRDSSMWG